MILLVHTDDSTETEKASIGGMKDTRLSTRNDQDSRMNFMQYDFD